MSGKAPKRKGDGYERELAKYFNEKVFVSYAENLKNGYSSTSVASAKFNEKTLNFKNYFRSAGFSMIELIVVIVLIGIFSSIADLYKLCKITFSL